MTSMAEGAAAAVALREVAGAADVLVASFAAHDRGAYFASFTPDSTFVFHTSAQRFATRADYEQEWATWEADGFHVDACESIDRRIDLITLEVAVMTHRVRTRLAGVEDIQYERETIVFRRTPEGRWLAVHEHLSPDPERDR